jgi:DNA-binding MarR family transcriptional regulator
MTTAAGNRRSSDDEERDRHMRASAAVQANLAQVIRHARMPNIQRRVMAESGAYLDRGAYAALFSVDVLTEPSLSDLAAEMQLDISTVSRQVRNLERAGLLEREAHPEDGRVWIVRNTEEGRNLALRISQSWQRAFSEALHTWSDTELEELSADLARFARSLREFATK